MTKCYVCGDYPQLIGAYVVRSKTTGMGEVTETPIKVKYCPECGRLLIEEQKNKEEK